MKLPNPSALERYINIFFVFTLSGIVHIIFDIVAGKVGLQNQYHAGFPILRFWHYGRRRCTSNLAALDR
jgi:hypothetical protein